MKKPSALKRMRLIGIAVRHLASHPIPVFTLGQMIQDIHALRSWFWLYMKFIRIGPIHNRKHKELQREEEKKRGGGKDKKSEEREDNLGSLQIVYRRYH